MKGLHIIHNLLGELRTKDKNKATHSLKRKKNLNKKKEKKNLSLGHQMSLIRILKRD